MERNKVQCQKRTGPEVKFILKQEGGGEGCE